MGLGRLRHAGPCSLPTGRAHDRVVLRLVEHLRSSGRAGPAYGGHHQPATALACHRHAGAACETNNDHRSEFTREGDSGREGVSRCRHFFARAGKKCRAVDGPATLAANPRESLPSFPSGPSVALAATPRARLTQQLSVEKSQKSAARPTPTAGFRIILPMISSHGVRSRYRDQSIRSPANMTRISFPRDCPVRAISSSSTIRVKLGIRL